MLEDDRKEDDEQNEVREVSEREEQRFPCDE